MIDLAVDIAALIESTITVEKVSVVAGEPAQTSRCSAAYVGGSTIGNSREAVDFAGNDKGCVYRRAYEFRYRIDICRDLPASGKEQTTAQQLAEAAELYDMADAVWCALAENASAGTLFDNIGTCEAVTIGTLDFDSPQGDRVSAGGFLRVTDPCVSGS